MFTVVRQCLKKMNETWKSQRGAVVKLKIGTLYLPLSPGNAQHVLGNTVVVTISGEINVRCKTWTAFHGSVFQQNMCKSLWNSSDRNDPVHRRIFLMKTRHIHIIHLTPVDAIQDYHLKNPFTWSCVLSWKILFSFFPFHTWFKSKSYYFFLLMVRIKNVISAIRTGVLKETHKQINIFHICTEASWVETTRSI